ncbi:hypothetical protein B0H17DRAFT_1195073 [Mycena rosella]|uniref:ABM domain-containing protein n=1 Tax=Mycena rosella TaxID=1033263 RepID=A0AAD7E052_MYCRO|nr:hypothetical protein B0H17DRAFT_1195073 [Mycena rosella]
MVHTILVHLYAKEGKEVEEKMRTTLTEASQIYIKDQETIAWFVMQDHTDPRAWCIVERYEQESSVKYHVENPHYKVFPVQIGPLLDTDKPLHMDIRRFNEIDVGQAAAE